MKMKFEQNPPGLGMQIKHSNLITEIVLDFYVMENDDFQANDIDNNLPPNIINDNMNIKFEQNPPDLGMLIKTFKFNYSN